MNEGKQFDRSGAEYEKTSDGALRACADTPAPAPILSLELLMTPPPADRRKRMLTKTIKRLDWLWGQMLAHAASYEEAWAPPEHGKKRVVHIRWQNTWLPSSTDEAMAGCQDTVIPHLLNLVERDVFGSSEMVPGQVPILWNDDPGHFCLEMSYDRSAPVRLTVEVWEVDDWNAAKLAEAAGA